MELFLNAEVLSHAFIILVEASPESNCSKTGTALAVAKMISSVNLFSFSWQTGSELKSLIRVDNSNDGDTNSDLSEFFRISAFAC